MPILLDMWHRLCGIEEPTKDQELGKEKAKALMVAMFPTFQHSFVFYKPTKKMHLNTIDNDVRTIDKVCSLIISDYGFAHAEQASLKFFKDPQYTKRRDLGEKILREAIEDVGDPLLSKALLYGLDDNRHDIIYTVTGYAYVEPRHTAHRGVAVIPLEMMRDISIDSIERFGIALKKRADEQGFPPPIRNHTFIEDWNLTILQDTGVSAEEAIKKVRY